MQILTSAQGWLLIGVFFVAMFSVIALLPKERKTKKMFLVGNRSVGNTEESMRAEIRKELLEGKKKGRDDRGFLLACKAWSKTERYSGLNLAVYRHILNMLSGGDMKSRTYRAFMIDLNASLRKSCGYE